jgi:hypothetical protein
VYKHQHDKQSEQRDTPAKAPAKKKPSRSQKVKSTDSDQSAPPPPMPVDLLNPKTLFNTIKQKRRADNPEIFAFVGNMVESAKALKGWGFDDGFKSGKLAGINESDKDRRARSIKDDPDKGTLIDTETLAIRISDALRKGNNTGADIKSMTTTLQLISPDLFRHSDKADRPDPCAIIKYLCTWSGAQGADMVKELGGAEFLATKLSEVLDTPVSVG